eukprot:CAMPEP_0170594908 /NCGR_PEP_ID=MMETSP0224-20130122/14259_1 /TAXON_ID=285029 /ORGANISM="Togula jolla, Strain CCCM 725" /LENGTH=78 /DNA_ID=CAMNT_0010919013 /DNA_START=23 /DNA_END=256 /DNA_ORIENTATION=+
MPPPAAGAVAGAAAGAAVAGGGAWVAAGGCCGAAAGGADLWGDLAEVRAPLLRGIVKTVACCDCWTKDALHWARADLE